MSRRPLLALAGVALLAAVFLALRPAGPPEPAPPPPAPPAFTSAAPRTGDTATPARAEMLKQEAEHYEQLRRVVDAEKALAMANDGHSRFVRGNLFQEREVIAVRSMMRLGQTELAQTRARRFLGRYPQGPSADLIRAAAGL